MFLLMGGLRCAIIGLVGVLNFFNAIMTGILSRKREIAVLQAVGMTKGQLKAMLVYEGLFYALSSALSALILSFVMNPLSRPLIKQSAFYADLTEVSDWAYEAMCWMSMNGGVNGKTGKMLDPKGRATHAEAAAMLYRYSEVMSAD